MKSKIDHLPQGQQRERKRVVQILFEDFADATAIATSHWKTQARILKVMLDSDPTIWRARSIALFPKQRQTLGCRGA